MKDATQNTARLPNIMEAAEMLKAVKVFRREGVFTKEQEAEATKLIGFTATLYLGALSQAVQHFAQQVQAVNAAAEQAKKDAEVKSYAKSPTEESPL